MVSGRVGAALSLVYGQRDGYTTNAITGNDLDNREAFSAKGQLLWTPAANWETRVILNGERARDGDYALERPRRAAGPAVHRRARLRGLYPPGPVRDDDPEPARRRPHRAHDHHGLRVVEDRGRDRSGLHAAAAPAAQQRRGGVPVHAGSARGLGGQRAGAAVRLPRAALAGRASSSSRRTTSRTRSTASRRSCCRRSSRSPSTSSRRCRRWTTRASGSSARARWCSASRWT